MSFHVPFEHRRNGQPIYIGFNQPPRRPRWNWWAFFGFPFSLFSLLTAGLLSPIALLVNLIALRRRPRRLATAGTVISLLGTGLLTAIVITATHHGVREHRRHEHVVMQRTIKKQVQATESVLESCSSEFESWRDAHDGQLPPWVDANMVALSYQDAWGQQLRFDAERDHAILRSAGPDGRFDNRDDVTRRIEGKSDRELLITVQ